MSSDALGVALRSVSPSRISGRLAELAAIGATQEGGVTRLGLSREEQAARDLVASWLSPLGFQCTTDDACNLLCAAGPAPRVLVGSHLDTVPDGGCYDGALGVVAAAELAQAAHEAGLEIPLEVVAWSAEEGARYRPGHFGSSAMFGQLPADAWQRSLMDGISVREAVRAVLAREPDPLSCIRATSEFLCYLELHTEQGPRLAADEAALGLVSSIVGMARGQIGFTGRADHAGTTPMSARSDALASAAECVLAVERVAREATEHLVGTVGELDVFPGAGNVVPGRCHLSIELRSSRDETRRAALKSILASVAAASERRGVRWRLEVADEIPAIDLSEDVIQRLSDACTRLGIKAPRLPSGAGHDAQNVMLAGIPTGMIFVRSYGGSHNPGERASADDTAAGIRAMLMTAADISGELER